MAFSLLKNWQLPLNFQVNWLGTQLQINAQTVQVGLIFIMLALLCSYRHYNLPNSTTGSI